MPRPTRRPQTGYKPRFEKAKKDILKEFPHATIEALEDPGTTGNFEVTDALSGALLHSKTGGNGFLDSGASKKALFAKIAKL